MKEATPIGELVARVLARAATLAGIQSRITQLPTAEARKNAIMCLLGSGLISCEECADLIAAYQLETA